MTSFENLTAYLISSSPITDPLPCGRLRGSKTWYISSNISNACRPTPATYFLPQSFSAGARGFSENGLNAGMTACRIPDAPMSRSVVERGHNFEPDARRVSGVETFLPTNPDVTGGSVGNNTIQNRMISPRVQRSSSETFENRKSERINTSSFKIVCMDS